MRIIRGTLKEDMRWGGEGHESTSNKAKDVYFNKYGDHLGTKTLPTMILTKVSHAFKSNENFEYLKTKALDQKGILYSNTDHRRWRRRLRGDRRIRQGSQIGSKHRHVNIHNVSVLDMLKNNLDLYSFRGFFNMGETHATFRKTSRRMRLFHFGDEKEKRTEKETSLSKTISGT